MKKEAILNIFEGFGLVFAAYYLGRKNEYNSIVQHFQNCIDADVISVTEFGGTPVKSGERHLKTIIATSKTLSKNAN